MQPVVKITSELVFFHHPHQVPIGCGDEPDVRPNSAIAADTLKLLVLDGAEQFRLEFERHLADLVEKRAYPEAPHGISLARIPENEVLAK
jgi:hypothetical protein